MENKPINNHGSVIAETDTLKNEIKNNKTKKILIFCLAFVLVLIIVGLVTKSSLLNDGPVDETDSLSVGQDELLDPRFSEADDTVFDYGSFPKDEIIDTTTYDIPTAEEDLSREFAEVINNSSTYSGIGSVYEVLSWDDFDKDGDIKEETMRAIIASVKAEAR